MNEFGQQAGAPANDGRWSADDLEQLRRALAGQYTIERELGRGGMGIVVLARDERLDRLVALKVLPPVLAQQPETRERFLREARMAAQLSHPNIVPVHRADDIGGFAFFAMGFVDGETLADRIRDRNVLQPPEVVRVLREVAWALAYAHARGIVHRDIKPENILLERGTGRAVVTDFGIARADFNPSLTQDGYILGTVHYMSPEQSSGEPLDGRSDLYALGCVGFFALSGSLPFSGSSPQAILIAHATKEPPSLGAVAPDLPSSLVNVIDRCLRKDPAERFATGEALADALEKALARVNQQSRESQAGAVMSSDDAMAVWRRAAELQAEAAARLESRLRAAAEPRAAGASPGVSVQEHADDATIPTDAYRVRDVEAAAAEAGISSRFVALAMAELQASPNASLMVHAVPEWKDRLSTRLFGTEQRSLSVSRVFPHPPGVVLPALGNALQAAPWQLTLRDTVGGHPLDGGVLVFDIPGVIDESYKWSYTRYGMFVPDLRVTLASLPGDLRSCEVTIQLDLRKGLNANLIGGAVLTSGGMFGGTIAGLALGKAALALAGAALVGPAFGGAMLVGVAALALSGPGYRYALRKSTKELEDALAAIDTSIRAVGIFGSLGKSGLPSKISQY